MLLFARMARLSHHLGRRSHNSAVAQYQKVIDKHFSRTGDLAWTGQQDLCTGRQLGGHAVAITAPIWGIRTDEQMKAHGHQDRAYENNVHPTRHLVGGLDKSPFP